MKVFVTGGTGYIGRSVIGELKNAGHQISALARSDNSAKKLGAAGVEVVRGNIKEPGGFLDAAKAADAAIHLAMEFDADTATTDKALVVAVTQAYQGTGKTFIYTSGIWVHGDTGGAIAKESDRLNPPAMVTWRPEVEDIAIEAASHGVRTIVIRPGMVYGRGGGFIGQLVAGGKKDGVVKFVGDGDNRWTVVHVDDLARLYIAALEKAPSGIILLGVSNESVTVRQLAEKAAEAAGVPGKVESWPAEEARKALGPLVDALIMSQRASSLRAETLLAWRHTGPGVLEDMAAKTEA